MGGPGNEDTAAGPGGSVTYSTPVQAAWVDYNGHLSEAYYVLIFGYATDGVMEQIGLGPAVRSATGSSLYTVEAHIRYLHEVGQDAEVSVRSTIVGAGAKKLHVAHEMWTGGQLVATEEILGLHVAGTPAAACPFPADIADRIAGLVVPERARPGWVGRSIR